jgi:D-alanine-D-alanine ligase
VSYPHSSEPRIAVVFNEPILPRDHPDAASEGDVVNVARRVAGALGEGGFHPFIVPAAPPVTGFLERLIERRPDVIFNLIEGFGGRSSLTTHVTSLFELLGVPYTGASVLGLACCQSKARTKALLRGLGLPATPSLLIAPGEPVPRPCWSGPSIVKPDAEDASLGIDQRSVVVESSKLHDRVVQVRLAFGGSVLVEPYLPGAEFNVGVIEAPEPRALPVAQVMFAPKPGQWPILTYAAKWDEGSEEDLASPVICPAPIADELASTLRRIALEAYRATGCRDYGRVDFRLDASGEPSILEVNPNPDLSPSAGFARAARVSGMTYDEAVRRIATRALERGRGA